MECEHSSFSVRAVFGMLLMECEQAALLNQEIELIRDLGGTTDKHGTDIGFGIAAQHVASMRLLKTKVHTNSHEGHNRQTAENAKLICIWCTCLRQSVSAEAC
eukprot:gnl/TRDRNA2_/TRDRNA2_96862_c0_seq1.p1 gnl/TRDRNA2_/TRDRNA2_96862_c0~~gnl/TRDRNA2_/TRDRNA2_96862_c0_seq1.p1  ORF type:complete len:103 (+),score=14.51 gnl/TRDRNA2_/TRDRNA2_96862_c0_seq1:146-454(+)